MANDYYPSLRNNNQQGQPGGILRKLPPLSPETPARPTSSLLSGQTPREPIFSTQIPKELPTGVANPEQAPQGFFSRLGSNKAALRAILSAGNIMQQSVDPEGRFAATGAFAGVEAGLNTYDTIKKNERLRKREETRAAGFAAAAEAPPAEQPQRLLTQAIRSGDAPLIKAAGGLIPDAAKPTIVPRGAAIQGERGEFTIPSPIASKPTIVKGLRGQFLKYDEASGKLSPLTEQEARIFREGEGVIGETGEIEYPAGAPRPASFTVGTGADRYEKQPDGTYKKIAEGREPEPRIPKTKDEGAARLSKLKSIEIIAKSRAGKPPARRIRGEFGQESPNPNYVAEKKVYDARIKEIKEELKIEANLTEAVPDTGEARPTPAPTILPNESALNRFESTQEFKDGFVLGEIETENNEFNGQAKVYDKNGELVGYFK